MNFDNAIIKSGISLVEQANDEPNQNRKLALICASGFMSDALGQPLTRQAELLDDARAEILPHAYGSDSILAAYNSLTALWSEIYAEIAKGAKHE